MVIQVAIHPLRKRSCTSGKQQLFQLAACFTELAIAAVTQGKHPELQRIQLYCSHTFQVFKQIQSIIRWIAFAMCTDDEDGVIQLLQHGRFELSQ